MIYAQNVAEDLLKYLKQMKVLVAIFAWHVESRVIQNKKPPEINQAVCDT